MFKTIVASAATLALTAAWVVPSIAQEPVAATTKAQCESLWTQALAGTSGDLGMDKAKPFVTDFKKADKNGDNKLSQVEWLDACGDRLIHSSAATGAGGGTSGTTEGKPTSDRTPGESSSPDRPTPSRPY